MIVHCKVYKQISMQLIKHACKTNWSYEEKSIKEIHNGEFHQYNKPESIPLLQLEG